MKISTIELKKLTPSEGMTLTNGKIFKKDDVYLGCNDNPDNWYEITDAEAEERIKDISAEPEAL
jgi:hypothetical protein